MRKIEKEMLNAVQGNTSWCKGNTQVISYWPTSVVFLHGNLIACWWHDDKRLDVNAMMLKECPTVTTKSRLRALGANLKQAKGILYLDAKPI